MSKRITRNSYKRKIVLVGIMLFMAIALISTGFAAWVISTGATKENTGGVEVGVVTAVDLELELAFKTGDDTLVFSGVDGDKKLYYTKNVDGKVQADTERKPFAYSFDTQKTDGNGRVRYQEGGLGEILSLTVMGTVDDVEFVKDVVITFVLPAGVVSAIEKNYIAFNKTYVKQADNTGLVTLTLTAQNNGLTLKTVPGTSDPIEPKMYEFEETLEFSWGTYFGEKNPGLFFDEEPASKDVTTDEVVERLNTLRAVIYGYDSEAGYQEYSESELLAKAAPTYALTITANIN